MEAFGRGGSDLPGVGNKAVKRKLRVFRMAGADFRKKVCVCRMISRKYEERKRIDLPCRAHCLKTPQAESEYRL